MWAFTQAGTDEAESDRPAAAGETAAHSKALGSSAYATSAGRTGAFGGGGFAGGAFGDSTRPLPMKVGQVALVAVLLACATAAVWLGGGTMSVYPHLFYVPVLLAAAQFGLPGAIVTGLVGGILVGPVMPLDRDLGLEQSTLAWLYRMVFLTGIGMLAAGLRDSHNRLDDRNRRTAAELYHAYGKCLTTFASLISMRDEPTAHHCERVALNAVTLGRAAGLGEQDLRELYWEGILHDLGKVATPAHILLKPGKLTEDEYLEVKKHAKMGADILESISDRFRILAEGVRSHHERWDGTGYPDGLAGASIPLNGRILAIVDVFEAVTSDRPYRAAMAPSQGVEIIYGGMGTHFDPELAQCFLDLYASGKILVQGDPIPKASAAFPVPGYAALRMDRA